MRKELFLPKTTVIEKNSEILSYCDGMSVLDIGMGGFIDDDDKNEAYYQRDLNTTLHGLINKRTKTLDGLDINPKAIERASTTFDGQYYLADLTRENLQKTIGKKYDLIVLGDVIEHLDSFHGALQNLRSLLAPGGKLIITTVNAYYIESIIKMLFRYESVHNEHTSYFSYITMKRLLSMNGLKILDFKYYSKKLKKFDSFAHWAGTNFSRFFTIFFPQYALGLFFVIEAGEDSKENDSKN